jgi:hypothetical protein
MTAAIVDPEVRWQGIDAELPHVFLARLAHAA